jgi:Spy/CpxP family protein refolding chaperone
MRKLVIAFFVLALMLGGISTAFAADCTKDTPFDQAWDWATTIGKQGMEKDKVLVKNKADRVAACTKKEAEKAAEAAKKAGEDMKKKLGF